MADGSVAELPTIKPENPVAPKPSEVNPSEKPIGQGEQEIIERINRDGDPDLVLQDLAQIDKTPSGSEPLGAEAPKGAQTVGSAVQTSENPYVKTQNFDEQAFKRVERSILVLQQYLKSLDPHNPKVEALAKEIFSQEELISAALQTDQHLESVITKLGLLISKGVNVKGMRGFVQRITMRNASRMEERLQNNSPDEVVSACLELFTNCIYGDYNDPNPMTGNRRGIDIGISALQRHFSAVRKGLTGELGNFDFVPMLRKILAYGNAQFSDQAISVMRQVIADRQTKV